MLRSALFGFALAASLVVLAGCENRDPYLRTDVWKPTGANNANITAMVADPHDLIRGRDDSRENAGEPALAVGRIWSDQPKKLGTTSAGDAASGGSGGGGSGGGSGSGS